MVGPHILALAPWLRENGLCKMAIPARTKKTSSRRNKRKASERSRIWNVRSLMRKRLHPSFEGVHCRLDTSTSILLWLFPPLLSQSFACPWLLWLGVLLFKGCDLVWCSLDWCFVWSLHFCGILASDNPFCILLFLSPFCHPLPLWYHWFFWNGKTLFGIIVIFYRWVALSIHHVFGLW